MGDLFSLFNGKYVPYPWYSAYQTLKLTWFSSGDLRPLIPKIPLIILLFYLYHFIHMLCTKMSYLPTRIVS